MKFKFIIIKNGVVIYVVKDAETAYVIKSIVCTRKYIIYSSTTNAEDKKTMRVVKSFYGKFTGTCRKIYIYRLCALVQL